MVIITFPMKNLSKEDFMNINILPQGVGFFKSVAWFTVFGLLSIGTNAMAQETGGIDIERFKPSLDSQGMVLTEAGQGEKSGDLNLGLYLHYSYRPLVIRDSDGKILQSLVKDRIAASFILSMGLFDWLTVGVEVPSTFWQDGAYIDNDGADLGLTSAGLGDIRVGLKVTILRQQSHGISMALSLPVTLPSGDEGAFLGSESLTFMPALTFSRSLIDDLLVLALNVGSWIQGETSYGDLNTGSEFFYRAGAMMNFTHDWSLSAEGVGAAKLESFGKNKPKETPLEWIFALHYHAPADLSFTLGGAVGSLPGWGTPVARAFLGVMWSPRTHDRDEDGISDHEDRCPDRAGPAENDGCPWQDSDSDGLTDDKDRCPHLAGALENKGCPWQDADKDGLKDNVDKCPKKAGPAENKGCPWPDTDKDGLRDNVDKCPKKAGPAENKGCPWPDTDKDGLNDNEDKCPKKAGPKENNGCPWGDRDSDGIKDNVDKCPDKKEDIDKFEDDDGCPDPDNDKDGVPDEKDKCPNKPETINGYRDEDGCPDKGKVVVIVKKEKIEILQKVYFATGKAVIKRKSYNLLNQVAQTIRAHEEIKKIRVEGHTDSQGSDKYNLRLSQNRADAVKAYLIKKGVDPKRLEAVGYGESRPIASNATRRGREQNRRVEFVIVDQH